MNKPTIIISMPKNSTKEEIADMYEYAVSFDYEALWEGVTVAGN